jgi:glutamyl-tRNA reductase
MNLLCLGINHRTAPIDIREKMWFSTGEVRAVLPLLKERYVKECILISTCNRTELYFLPHENKLNGEPFWKILASFKKAEPFVEEKHFYSLSSLNAVKHLFNVASSIDSMVLGDVQIISQVKESFSIAQETQCTGAFVTRLVNSALHVGKRSRTETEIGEGAVSVSYAAAELASKIFEDLSKRTALLIGAGETGKLTAKHLAGRNLGKLLLANRTRKRAEELVAQLGGNVVDFDQITNELLNVDIVISSVESPSYILSTSDLRQIMRVRGSRPLFIIDIGVPRNIEPTANGIENVFLHDIDALNHIIDNNLARRTAEIPKVRQIVLDELINFNNWNNSLQVNPTIQELREQFETIRKSEVEKHRHHFNADKEEELEMLTKRIVNKILHTPMVNLKNGHSAEGEDETRNKIHLLRHLFGLDKKEPE